MTKVTKRTAASKRWQGGQYISASELKEKIALHKKWLDGDGGERLVLIGYDLRDSDLRDSDLRDSDLRDSDLRGSDLGGSDLSSCDLSGCDLSGCYLRSCDLIACDLGGSDLRDSDLRDSDLGDSDMSGCDMRGCNLSGCNLSGCDLDFSALPLWCGGSNFRCSEHLIQQLFAHISSLTVEDASDEMVTALEAIKGEAEKSHRASDLGVLWE